MAGDFRLIDERTVFEGAVIQVGVARFSTPDGAEIDRDIVHHPGAVVVVPVDDEGNVTLVRQFRAAIAGPLLEIPAGKRDVADEPTEITAARELAEEVGLVADRLTLVGTFLNSPGFCDELSFCYLATGLTTTERQAHGEEEHHMTVEQVHLRDVPGLIASGALSDAKTIIGLLLAREHLGVR